MRRRTRAVSALTAFRRRSSRRSMARSSDGCKRLALGLGQTLRHGFGLLVSALRPRYATRLSLDNVAPKRSKRKPSVLSSRNLNSPSIPPPPPAAVALSSELAETSARLHNLKRDSPSSVIIPDDDVHPSSETEFESQRTSPLKEVLLHILTRRSGIVPLPIPDRRHCGTLDDPPEAAPFSRS